MNAFRLSKIFALCVVAFVGDAQAGDRNVMNTVLRDRIGGGNLVTHLTGAPSIQLYEALRGVGARLGRMDSYGWRDETRKPNPHNFDAAILEAYRQGIKPIILLEYEGSYQFLNPPQPIGSYHDWLKAGQAFAQRFRPDGDWGRENGIRGWGVTVYTAINEPDVQNSIPKDAYRDALAGFADGVHGVDTTLRVVPGGFATCNSHGDATLRGYGPAIAGLLQEGKLDGIDLHTYYNAMWYPIAKGREFSVQTCFDRIKAALRLTRDIDFYATEFNVARDGDWLDPKVAARMFLTAFWDQVGVVRNDRKSSATVLAFPWNLADTGRIEGIGYAMATHEGPWQPDARAKVLRDILRLAGDMRFVSLDPDAGRITLQGEAGRLMVWQNLLGWTQTPGLVWEVALPEGSDRAELWGYDGLRRTITAQGGKLIVTDLKVGETVMLYLPRRR